MGKESACNAGDNNLTSGSGRSPGEGNGNPLHYPCLENPMDRGAWGAIVHGVAKSQTCLKWLSTHTWAESRKMVLMNMFSGSNRDRENRRVNTAQGRRRWGELWEHWDIYITVCKTDTQQKWLYHTGSSTRCSVTIHMGRMVCGWGSGWRQVQEGRDICILLANSCSCMTETNTTLYSNYPLMRNVLK